MYVKKKGDLTMRPVLVRELAELLNKAVREDKGDYVVLVNDDEECNGYHELWNKVKITQGKDVEFLDEKSGEWKLRNSIVLS